MAESDNQSWQTTLSTVRERIEYAFNNALYPDITFTVDDSNGDKVSLPANRFILTISSPVFEKMFQGQLAEKGPEIHLPDCTENGLREMLRFVHYDVISLTGRNVMEVIYLADKYMLPFLEKRCYNYLANELTPGEVFHVLPQAKKTGNTKAEELCWNIVDLETLPAVTSQPFLNISRDLLKQVLERETLQADEIDLFKAIDAWASNRIENDSDKRSGDAKRKILGDEVVHLIRFPVMTQEDFADEALVCNILKQNEVTEVVQVLTSIQPVSTSFKRIKREGQWNEKWTENRFTHVETSSTYRDDKHCIAFEVNKPIFLAGIKLFSIGKKAPMNIEIVKTKTGFVQTELELNNCTPQQEGNYYIYLVKMHPVLYLEPKEKYSLTATIDKNASGYNNTYKGTGGKREISISPDIKLTFTNADDSYDPKTTVDFGQFPSFLFKRKIKVGNDNESDSESPPLLDNDFDSKKPTSLPGQQFAFGGRPSAFSFGKA